MSMLIRSLLIAILATNLTSCIAVAAGAAGGWYVGKNYEVDVHKKSQVAHAKKRKAQQKSEDEEEVATN